MSIVNVDCTDLQNNPNCAHGPTLKFSRLVKGRVKVFYACSAYRDRKDCPFFMLEGEKLSNSKQLLLEEWKKKTLPSIQHDLIINRFEDFKKIHCKTKHFCLTCFDFVFPSELETHKSHLLSTINLNSDFNPRQVLFPLTKNKSEAQYWFSEKTITFIHTNIDKVKFNKVLCIGTPTLHDYLIKRNVASLLLDIDYRYHWFYNKSEFIWFNMFNFHFMGDKDSCLLMLTEYLKAGSILVIIDPPFGARIEPLSHTLKMLEGLTSVMLYMILILPYFMEPQVLKSFPKFNMLDFPIEYTNHKKFKDKGSPKTSPVRIFTNIPSKNFVFPPNEGYYFCKFCQAWRSKMNKHCGKCNLCPSKNGASYRHCLICKTCVKKTWQHCNFCNKCALMDHNCKRQLKAPGNKKKKIKH